MFHFPSRPFVTALLLGMLAACKSDGDSASDSTPSPEPVDGFHFEVGEPATQRLVDPRMAGANYLHTRDRLDGTFGPRAEAMGVSYLRWPGGAMSENEQPYHDAYFTDGDSRNWEAFSHDAPWSLSHVSNWAEARGMGVMVMLPTKKYVLAPGQIDEAAIRREIGPFVREVTRGRFGPVPDLLEIGNEFYWGNDKIEAEDYTAVARIVLEEIRANQAAHINVAVQGGRLGHGMIGRVASAFSAEEKAQIDFIADHIYTRNFQWTNYDDRFRMYRNNWGDKPLIISEWNVKSTSTGDPQLYAWGIEQAAPMVQVWDAMIRDNTKIATFWAVQQNTKAAAFPNEGVDPEVEMFIGGRVFRWLADTSGMMRLDVVQRGEDGMGAFAYRDGNRVIAFIAGLEAGQNQVVLEFPGRAVNSATGTRMSGERDLAKQVPQLSSITPAINGSRVQATINRQSAQELIRLDIELEP